MWAYAHAQKINIPVSMVTAADTPIFRVFFFFFFFFFLENFHAESPDNRGSTVGSRLWVIQLSLAQFNCAYLSSTEPVSSSKQVVN